MHCVTGAFPWSRKRLTRVAETVVDRRGKTHPSWKVGTTIGRDSANQRQSPEGSRDISLGSPKLEANLPALGVSVRVQLVITGLLACGQWPSNAIALTGNDLQGSLELSSANVLQLGPCGYFHNSFLR